MLSAVQTLLVKYSSDKVTGRIFGYNQSFMYLGNVVGPLIGAGVSAMAGYRLGIYRHGISGVAECVATGRYAQAQKAPG